MMDVSRITRGDLNLVPGPVDLRDLVREAAKRAPAPSVVIVVGGSRAPLAKFRAVETVFGSDTQVLVFRAELGAASRITRVGESIVVTVGGVDEPSRLVRRVRP